MNSVLQITVVAVHGLRYVLGRLAHFNAGDPVRRCLFAIGDDQVVVANPTPARHRLWRIVYVPQNVR
jgi:hypothetical protein